MANWDEILIFRRIVISTYVHYICLRERLDCGICIIIEQSSVYCTSSTHLVCLPSPSDLEVIRELAYK
jgi:hypothetical protein